MDLNWKVKGWWEELDSIPCGHLESIIPPINGSILPQYFLNLIIFNWHRIIDLIYIKFLNCQHAVCYFQLAQSNLFHLRKIFGCQHVVYIIPGRVAPHGIVICMNQDTNNDIILNYIFIDLWRCALCHRCPTYIIIESLTPNSNVKQYKKNTTRNIIIFLHKNSLFLLVVMCIITKLCYNCTHTTTVLISWGAPRGNRLLNCFGSEQAIVIIYFWILQSRLKIFFPRLSIKTSSFWVNFCPEQFEVCTNLELVFCPFTGKEQVVAVNGEILWLPLA